MKVFVTGGAGFIGGRIVHQLLDDGHSVTVFDNLSTGHRQTVPDGARLVVGDMRSREQLDAAIPGHDAVIHLAAQSIVPISVADPQLTFDINLTGGINLLEAMRAAGVTRFVQSSTAAVYGNPVRVPIAEDDPTMPINPYGASKLAFEALLNSYHANYGFDVTIFRYFNPYGPTEAHDPESHAVANFITATLTGKPLPMYWNGEQERDFFFVDDIARAHVMGLAQNGLHVYNLGSGKTVSIREVSELIFELVGKRVPTDDLGERAGDPPRLLADTARVHKELGWAPKVSLRDGLRQTVDAFKAKQLPEK